MTLLIFIFLVFGVSIIVIIFNLYSVLVVNKIISRPDVFGTIEVITIIFWPFVYLFLFDLGMDNDCCTESAVFSPDHRINIYILIALYSISYLICMFRNGIFAPVAEMFLNIFLLLGIVINVLLCIHLHTGEEGIFYWGLGNVPIILLLMIRLINNHRLILNHIANEEMEVQGFLGRICWKILSAKQFIKYPILLFLLIPILILFALMMILFGQKPDALIRVFTDTYKHGFSQLDYMCENVECDGHFLCTIGAKGHKKLVKPVRFGERNGRRIICNRQLLISNAFEDLIKEKFPLTHKHIRKNYNTVGVFVNRYYSVFHIKIIADIVYIIMKPLEWIFVFALYTFDKKPENRIAMQYLKKEDREKMVRSSGQ